MHGVKHFTMVAKMLCFYGEFVLEQDGRCWWLKMKTIFLNCPLLKTRQ